MKYYSFSVNYAESIAEVVEAKANGLELVQVITTERSQSCVGNKLYTHTILMREKKKATVTRKKSTFIK